MQERMAGFALLSPQVRENFVSVQKRKGYLNIRFLRQIPLKQGAISIFFSNNLEFIPKIFGKLTLVV